MANKIRNISQSDMQSDIIDVIDLYEAEQFVIVKTINYDNDAQAAFANIEIGFKDGNDDIVTFKPISKI